MDPAEVAAWVREARRGDLRASNKMNHRHKKFQHSIAQAIEKNASCISGSLS